MKQAKARKKFTPKTKGSRMKFLVGSNKRVAMQVACLELQWLQVTANKLIDLYGDEVLVISKASEMQGYDIEVVYLLPSFEHLSHDQWEGFQCAFAKGEIKTKGL